jgi:hypothetical protein
MYHAREYVLAGGLMSYGNAYGPKRTRGPSGFLSAFGGKADRARTSRDVR